MSSSRLSDTFGPKPNTLDGLAISTSQEQDSLFVKLKSATDDELRAFVGIKFNSKTYTISSIVKPTEDFPGFTIKLTTPVDSLPPAGKMEVQIYV